MESLAPFWAPLRAFAVGLGPFILVLGAGMVIRRHQHRKMQAAMQSLAEQFGLRPIVQRPGLFRSLGSPGLVGRFDGQEVRITVYSSDSQKRERQEDKWVVSLRLRTAPALSTEFSAIREKVTTRLLQRFKSEEKVGDEDLDELLYIRSLGAGDREVLRLQPIQNGLFRLVRLGTFEFKEGALHLDARGEDWIDLAESVLENAQNFARALAHDAVADHHDGVWSV